MYFAFFYLFFFALNILLATRFFVLGMVPMHFLVAGVGFFVCFYLGKRFSLFPIYKKDSILPKIFFAYVLIVSLFNFFGGLCFSIGLFREFLLRMHFIPDQALCAFSGFLSLWISFLVPLKSSLLKWMLYSVVAGFIRYSVPLVFGLPVWLYRYLGVLDLIMLFGWLMMIITLMRLEYGFESYVTRDTALH